MNLIAPFLEALGRVSAQAAVLVLLVLFIQRIFQRWLTPRWHCALWLLVIGRLILFVSLAGMVLTDAQSPKPRGDAIAATPSDNTPTNAPPVREVRRGADPLPQANNTNLPSHALTMIVLDAESGSPLAEAEISVPIMDWGKSALPRRPTDTQGRYVVHVPLPQQEHRARVGNFNLALSHPDYVGAEVSDGGCDLARWCYRTRSRGG